MAGFCWFCHMHKRATAGTHRARVLPHGERWVRCRICACCHNIWAAYRAHAALKRRICAHWAGFAGAYRHPKMSPLQARCATRRW